MGRLALRKQAYRGQLLLMIINNQYEFIFVAIARTGSTSIKSVLQPPDELKKLIVNNSMVVKKINTCYRRTFLLIGFITPNVSPILQGATL